MYILCLHCHKFCCHFHFIERLLTEYGRRVERYYSDIIIAEYFENKNMMYLYLILL